MVQQESSFTQNGEAAHTISNLSDHGITQTDINVDEEINRVEEIIFDSFHIPLTGVTILKEEKVLRQLDKLRQKIPVQFEQALDILKRQELIISEAEDHARQIVESAKKRANQILNETGIIQQAQIEAHHITQQATQECEALRHQTLTDVEKMRFNAHAELEQLRQMTIQESESIQRGADDYADAVLNNLEHNLHEMLRIIENGRRQIDRPH